jgi:hypothetical protein
MRVLAKQSFGWKWARMNYVHRIVSSFAECQLAAAIDKYAGKH